MKFVEVSLGFFDLDFYPTLYADLRNYCAVHDILPVRWLLVFRAHRVAVRPTNNVAGKYPDPNDVIATTKKYKDTIKGMSYSTTYEIRVSTSDGNLILTIVLDKLSMLHKLFYRSIPARSIV